MDRPEYKKLLTRIREELNAQANEPFIAIDRMCLHDVRSRDLDELWPKLMAELGLIDDGTKTGTYTLPGRGITRQAAESRVAHVMRVIQGLTPPPPAPPRPAPTPKAHEGVSPEDIKRRWKAWKKDDPARASVSLKQYVKDELAKLPTDAPLAVAYRTWLEG